MSFFGGGVQGQTNSCCRVISLAAPCSGKVSQKLVTKKMGQPRCHRNLWLKKGQKLTISARMCTNVAPWEPKCQLPQSESSCLLCCNIYDANIRNDKQQWNFHSWSLLHECEQPNISFVHSQAAGFAKKIFDLAWIFVSEGFFKIFLFFLLLLDARKASTANQHDKWPSEYTAVLYCTAFFRWKGASDFLGASAQRHRGADKNMSILAILGWVDPSKKLKEMPGQFPVAALGSEAWFKYSGHSSNIS